MDHRYIDQHSVAGRYLDHELPADQRAEFEAHLVDCQECTDRILLAGMFHSRNGHKKVRVTNLFTPWQLFWILAAASVLLVLVTAFLLLWVIRSR